MDHELLYTNELTFLCYGRPVWEPDPNGLYDCVQIGDVGCIEDGKFMPLFNILPPTPSNPNRPVLFAEHHFRPLQLPSNMPTTHRTSSLTPSVYGRESALTFSASTGVDIAGSAGCGEFSLSFTKEKGAALILPFEARREDTLHKKRFRTHMLACYRQWYRFAVDECARDIRLSDLLLVTGCDLTRQWAMATYDRSSQQIAVSLGAQATAMVGASFSLGAGWRTVQPVRTRQGPDDIEDRTERMANDQCVFLRGFYVKERRFVGPKVIKAGAGDHDPGNHGPVNEEEGVLTDANVTVESLSLSTNQENLITVLLDYMLEESNADIVIAHDSDLWQYLGELEEPEDLHDALKKMCPYIKVEDGVGSLVTEGAEGGEQTIHFSMATSASHPSATTGGSGSGNSKELLNSYCQNVYRTSGKVKYYTESSDGPLDSRWTSICYVDDIEYGRAAGRRSKRLAEDAAASKALAKISANRPL